MYEEECNVIILVKSLSISLPPDQLIVMHTYVAIEASYLGYCFRESKI